MKNFRLLPCLIFVATGMLPFTKATGQMTPAGFNQLMVDQKNWQLKQLPRHSVQRQMEWSKIPYEGVLFGKKETLSPVDLPRFQRAESPMDHLLQPPSAGTNAMSTQETNVYRLSRLPKRYLAFAPSEEWLFEE